MDKIRTDLPFIGVGIKPHDIYRTYLNSAVFIILSGRVIEGEIVFAEARTRKKIWEAGRCSETSAERSERGVLE